MWNLEFSAKINGFQRRQGYAGLRINLAVYFYAKVSSQTPIWDPGLFFSE